MTADLSSRQVAAMAGIRLDTFYHGKKPAALGSGPDRRAHYYRPDDVAQWLVDRVLTSTLIKARNAEIVRECGSGARYLDVARVRGLSPNQVSKIATGGGVCNRPRRSADLRKEAVRYARAHSFDAAAKLFGVCRRSLFVWAKEVEGASSTEPSLDFEVHAAKPSTKRSNEREALRLRASGMIYKDIAKRLGISVTRARILCVRSSDAYYQKAANPKRRCGGCLHFRKGDDATYGLARCALLPGYKFPEGGRTCGKYASQPPR